MRKRYISCVQPGDVVTIDASIDPGSHIGKKNYSLMRVHAKVLEVYNGWAMIEYTINGHVRRESCMLCDMEEFSYRVREINNMYRAKEAAYKRSLEMQQHQKEARRCREIRRRALMKQSDMAAFAKVSRMQIAKFETNKPISYASRRQMLQAYELVDRLNAIETGRHTGAA